MRQRLPVGTPFAVLGLALTGLAAYVLSYALDATAFLNDEYGMVIGGRRVAADPMEALTASTEAFGRGPERLTPILLAVPDALFGSAPDEMRAGHVLLTVAYLLVAVPTLLLLRGLGVPRWPAAGLALAAVVGPWMVFGVPLLNVTLAAPLTILFAWLTWRAVVRPSIGAELLAVAAAALMTTARASHATFFAAAVVAAAATAWWTREPGESLLRLPGRIARRTPVITAVTLLGALALAVFGTSSLAGRDYAGAAELDLPLEAIWAALGWTTAVLTIATGFLPLIIGGAWALRQAVRPTDVAAGAFAVIAVSIFFAYVYLMGASGAQMQERYPAVLAALPVVAFGAALFRREAWVLGTALVALLAARAIATRGIVETAEPLSYFFSPAQLFFSKAVVGRLTVTLPGDAHMVTIATLGIALVAVAVAFLAARRGVAVAALLAVIAVGLGSGIYSLRKYEPATGPGDLDAVAWLDRAGGGDDAVFWNHHWPALAADRDFRTRLTLFHNSSACCYEWRPGTEFLRPGGRLDRERTPRVVAGFHGFRPVVFAARQTSRPVAYGFQMRVERFVDDPPRAAALVRGAGEDGAVERSAEIVALPALEGSCLDVEVATGGEEPVGFAVGDRRGVVRPGTPSWVRVRGGATVRPAGRDGAPVVLGEIRFVDCADPPTTR